MGKSILNGMKRLRIFFGVDMDNTFFSHLKNKHVMSIALITGGSSGIGLEISKRFAKNGYTICWVSLFEKEVKEAQKEILNEFPDTTIHFLIQDLSKEDGATHVYDWVRSKSLDIDVLINNAGIGTFGMSTDIPMEKEVSMINLNVISVYKMTRMFFDEFSKKNKGTIINISSAASFLPMPRLAAYAATKAFVAHYSQGLQEELKEQGSKVKVITVCPAAIKDTKFKVAANMEHLKAFEGITVTTKKEVADDVWKAFQKGITYIRTGAKLRNSIWLTKILPKSIVLRILKHELSEK